MYKEAMEQNSPAQAIHAQKTGSQTQQDVGNLTSETVSLS